MQLTLAALLSLTGAAHAQDPIAADLDLVLHAADAPARAAAARLSAAGQPALAPVTVALRHAGSTVEQRARLVGVIAHMKPEASGEAAPLLGELAQHDGDGLVRAEAEWTLKHWAAERNPRGDRARAELRQLDAARGRSAPG